MLSPNAPADAVDRALIPLSCQPFSVILLISYPPILAHSQCVSVYSQLVSNNLPHLVSHRFHHQIAVAHLHKRCETGCGAGGVDVSSFRVGTLMLTISKLKRTSVNYYTDTAKAAGRASSDLQKAPFSKMENGFA